MGSGCSIAITEHQSRALLTEGDGDVKNESLAELSSDGSNGHVEGRKNTTEGRLEVVDC